MDQKNNIRVFQAASELTEAAAKFIIEVARKAVYLRGRFVISLSGGHTPEQLYALLSKPPFRDEMPWAETFVFWGDERFVAADDRQNNAHLARSLLLDQVNVPPGNVFPIPVEPPPVSAAGRYENTLKEFFKNEIPKFDLILLGIGENGHTASLFPGNNLLIEPTDLVKAVYVGELQMYRITMTPNLINQAHHILFLAEGDSKAEILKKVLTGPYRPDKFPAQLIKPEDGDIYWFIDNRAAALLPD